MIWKKFLLPGCMICLMALFFSGGVLASDEPVVVNMMIAADLAPPFLTVAGHMWRVGAYPNCCKKSLLY